MTEEDRIEAERLAQVWSFDDHGYNGFLDGYRAAAEKFRARDAKSEYDQGVADGRAEERARIAVLIESLFVEDAIAEYESSSTEGALTHGAQSTCRRRSG